MKEHVSTQVCIIGARPAGTLLRLLLQEAQIDCLVVEQLSQEDILGRAPRAGLIEDRTKELLIRHAQADRMLAEGRPNRCCEFRTDGEGFVLDYAVWTALSAG